MSSYRFIDYGSQPIDPLLNGFFIQKKYGWDMADTQFIRQKKEKNYTVLDNTFIQDCELSWKAKGLMTYLLSLPEDWAIYLSELEKHATDGKDSLRSAIKELEEKGYLEKSQNVNNGKFAGYSYTIYEVPLRKNRCGKTVAEKPFTENPQLLNTNDIQSTNKQSTNYIKEKQTKSKNNKAPLFDEVDNFTNNLELRDIIKKWLSMMLKSTKNYELEQFKIQLENLSKVQSDEIKIEIVKNHYSNNYRALVYENEIDKNKKTYTSRYDNAGMHVDKNHDYSQDGGKVDENGMIGF